MGRGLRLAVGKMRGTTCPWSGLNCVYTPYEGLNLTNQKSRKLDELDRKFEGTSFPFAG